MRTALLGPRFTLAACLAAASASACYSPTFRDCAQACGPGASCPPGFLCENAVCRLPEQAGTSCEAPGDVNPSIDINPASCTWALVSTNFAPADVPDEAPPPWDVTSDETFTTGGVVGHAVSQTDAEPLWIVHYSRFTVAADVTLTLEGDHPLVIAADEMDIKGTIVVHTGRGHSTCNAAPGADSCNAGAGGGGGGYGGDGGDGGGPPATNGGQRDGILPTPLRGGCAGAKGGDGRTGAADAIPQSGGMGGVGGGALQLSARNSITLEGSILANGSGGLPGRSDRVFGGACGATGRASGGGAGGGGGTIMIESCQVVIGPTAKLCANGGSGAGGAGGGNTDIGSPGSDGSCDAQAIGGAGEVAGAQGGNGGFDGLPATAGAQASRGGGGGGGAVGRIHIGQVAGMPVTAGATIRPPANRSQ